jgi:hypothetical protein
MRFCRLRGLGSFDKMECSISGSSASISRSSLFRDMTIFDTNQLPGEKDVALKQKLTAAKRYTDTAASLARRKSKSRDISPYSSI